MDKALVFGFHPPKIVRSNRIVVEQLVSFFLQEVLSYAFILFIAFNFDLE